MTCGPLADLSTLENYLELECSINLAIADGRSKESCPDIFKSGNGKKQNRRILKSGARPFCQIAASRLAILSTKCVHT